MIAVASVDVIGETCGIDWIACLEFLGRGKASDGIIKVWFGAELENGDVVVSEVDSFIEGGGVQFPVVGLDFKLFAAAGDMIVSDDGIENPFLIGLFFDDESRAAGLIDVNFNGDLAGGLVKGEIGDVLVDFLSLGIYFRQGINGFSDGCFET